MAENDTPAMETDRSTTTGSAAEKKTGARGGSRAAGTSTALPGGPAASSPAASSPATSSPATTSPATSTTGGGTTGGSTTGGSTTGGSTTESGTTAAPAGGQRTATVNLPFVTAVFRAPDVHLPGRLSGLTGRLPGRMPGRRDVDAAARRAGSYMPSGKAALYYGGLAATAVAGIIEWPVAAAIGVGSALASRGEAQPTRSEEPPGEGSSKTTTQSTTTPSTTPSSTS